jgi:hypothetical protein
VCRHRQHDIPGNPADGFQPSASGCKLRPEASLLPVIEIAFLNSQPGFLFACHGPGYSMALSAVTGEVVLRCSLA